MLKNIAIVLASAVAAVLVWQGLHDDVVMVPRVEIVKEYVIAPPSVRADPTIGPSLNAGTTPAGAPLPKAAPVKGNELGRRLLDTKDVKAFVLDALKQPEKGGAFYATLALRQCGEMAPSQEIVQRVVAEESTISTDRMNKITAVVDRCSQLAGDDITALRAEAIRLGKDGTDPVMALQLQMTKTRAGTPERNALLEEMLKTNEAITSENFVAMRLLQQSMTVADDGAITYRFNGQTYSSVADQQAISAATRLSGCTGADYCALDFEINAICKGGTCYASREDYMLQTAFNGDRALLDKALQFSEQIRSAVARGDTSIFH